MNKLYAILLDNEKIGVTRLEYGDPPMGVAFGNIDFADKTMGYDFFKKYCKDNKIELASDSPEDKLIGTRQIISLQIFNEAGTEIKGDAVTIEGMDSEGFQINIFGIPYPFYEEEFPHHVKEYNERFK